MSKELVIGSNRHETKVAVLEDDQLVELYFQRGNEYSLAGSIHKGRVTRVLPGMQSAFVDLGLERDTFLYVSDFFDELNGDEIDTVADDKPTSRSSVREPELSTDRVREENRPRDENRVRDDNRPRDDSRSRDDSRGRDHRRDRGSRPAGDRPNLDRPVVASTIEPDRIVVAPPARFAEPPLQSDDVTSVSAEPVSLAGEARVVVDGQVRPPGGDRNKSANGERDGDKRNRRSRRRRGRGGRGIPDNKYAQPTGGSESASSVPEPHAEEAEPHRVDAIADDVMMLPGESLAKYRSRPESLVTTAPVYNSPVYKSPVDDLPKHDLLAADAPVAHAPIDHLRADEFVESADFEEDDLDAEIDEEAAALELTDKVFGHQENEHHPLVEEFKLAEVRQDHAAPEALHASSLSSEMPSAIEPAPKAALDPTMHQPAMHEPDLHETGTHDTWTAHPGEPPVESHPADVLANLLSNPAVERAPEPAEGFVPHGYGNTRDLTTRDLTTRDLTTRDTTARDTPKPERLADISPEQREDEAAVTATGHAEAEGFELGSDELEEMRSFSGVHDLVPEFEETLEPGDFETDEPEALTETTSEAAGGETGTQTASLREQGGRYPHRSRRMRRRRGGNRPAGEGVVSSPAISAGAAPALQADARLEFRDGREPKDAGADHANERPEERSADRPERQDRADRVMPSISDLLKAGQEIIVQIAKEPLGQKGARITSHIALPGRYVVFMPSVNHLGVSRKVSTEEERHRLKRILQAHRVGTTGGFIVRTAGEGVPEEEIAADMNFLYTLWLDIRQKAEKKPAPMLLHYDLDVVQRILRDQITEDFKAIWVDNEDLYESVLTFMQRFQPALVNRVKMYTRSAPIFDAFNITQELEKALRPKVWLKSGGYLVINQTEALVAIDINTGKYVGRSNRLEDTIVKTNTEAVKEIVRQIRLRDLGGIIVVDFIDMDERKNRQKVMQALEEAMCADKAPYKILQFNDFGLVAITRKRVKQSLERTLCAPCHYCEGAGYVKSTQTVIGEILIEAQKISKAIEGKDVLLRVHPEVAKILKASDNKYLEELEEILGRPVLVKSDAALHSEKFDLG